MASGTIGSGGNGMTVLLSSLSDFPISNENVIWVGRGIVANVLSYVMLEVLTKFYSVG